MARPHADGGWDWSSARAICLQEAKRYERDDIRAQDIAQDALVRAWRRRASCRTPSAPGPWLRAVTRNEALRRGPDRREVALDEAADLPAPEHDTPDSVAARVDLARALTDLPTNDQELVRLRYFEDMSQPATARAAGLAEGTAKVRLHRLRAKLRERLED